jgi:hypothetical protein
LEVVVFWYLERVMRRSSLSKIKTFYHGSGVW